MQLVSLILVLSLFIYLTGAVYRRLWDRELSLSLSFSRADAFEGDTLRLTEVLTNRKFLPLPWVAVKFQVSRHLLFADQTYGNVSDDYYKSSLFSVMSYQKITRNLDFVCGKRGFYKIKSAELLGYNLLLTQKMVTNAKSAAFLTVYPKLLPTDEMPLDSNRITGEIVSKRFLNPDPFEFRGIREYANGDDFKTVNFSATAKYGELMVNMYEFTVSREVIIYLNFEPYAAWTDEALFEKTISLAATLSQQCIQKGIPVRLISGSPDVITAKPTDTGTGASLPHLFGIYDALAKLDLKPEPAPIIGYLPEPVYYANESKVHILISTFRNDALAARFNELKKAYGNIFWIWPHTVLMKENAPQDGAVAWCADL